MSTSISLAAHRQSLVCDGGDKNACGQRGLPERGHETSPLFVRAVNFDPAGQDSWMSCTDDAGRGGGGGPGGLGAAAGTGSMGAVAVQSSSSLTPAAHNSYTFRGSYYTIYVKVASCDTPQGENFCALLPPREV